jgi:hypothetical protein
MRSNSGSSSTSEETEFARNSRIKFALQEGWAFSFCTLAAISATFLSGIHFPEQNNIWTIPIVLDFAHSVEGPHDAYNKTFAHFVSYLWILVRMISTEQNVQMVFILLQLLGNCLLSALMYAFIRTITKNIALSAMIAAGFCFCYGLWGPTRLGYAEVFVTCATHTQFAIIGCLFGILLLVHLRILWASIFFGLAANINLYMAFWTTAAGGLFTVALERRLPTWRQIKFAVIMILVSTPTLVWAFSGATIHRPAIPTSHFHIYSGHIYALVFPQALTQTLALGLVAALAMIANHKDNLPARRLGIITLAA